MFASVLDAPVCDVKPSAFAGGERRLHDRRGVGLAAGRTNADRVDDERQLRRRRARPGQRAFSAASASLEDLLNLRVDVRERRSRLSERMSTSIDAFDGIELTDVPP